MLINQDILNQLKSKAKLSFCLGIFTLAIAEIRAQQTHVDSVNVGNLEKEIRVAYPELSFSKPLQFTDAYAYFNLTDLEFKRVQTPSKITEYGFGSQGVFVLNPKIILSGNLQVSTQNETDVPFILTDERTINQNYISNPAYFYVPRKSDWMKQNYEIGGSMAYQPFKNFFVTASVNGSFLKAYANSDPRPEIGNFQYNADIKIGYRYQKHALFGKIAYVNRKKESWITYSVSELNAPNYYDTYIRFNRGYGNYYYNDKFGNTVYNYDGLSYGGEYQFDVPNTSFILGFINDYYIDRNGRYYEYQIRDENNYLQNYRDFRKVAGLKTERNTVYAELLTRLGSWKWASALDVSDQKDQNYDYENLYTSYRVYNFSARFRNVLSKYNSKNELLRLSFEANVGDQDIKDISVVLQKKLTYFNYQIGGEKEIRLDKHQKLGLELKQGLYLPINKDLYYSPYQSNQENVFVKNIVFPDYFYDTSTHMNIGMKLKYMFDKKNVRYEAYVSGDQFFFVSNSTVDKSGYNTNANRVFAFGINFYY